MVLGGGLFLMSEIPLQSNFGRVKALRPGKAASIVDAARVLQVQDVFRSHLGGVLEEHPRHYLQFGVRVQNFQIPLEARRANEVASFFESYNCF